MFGRFFKQVEKDAFSFGPYIIDSDLWCVKPYTYNLVKTQVVHL
jgi:hypothetical protein